MSRILLVDDSPHAQRMGERILSEEGFEVVTVSNADSALIRLDDVDPDVVLADTVMPGRSGYEICQFVKMSPRHRHVRVVLTAGVLEPLDDEHVRRVQADATLKKPFEASVLLATIKPLAERAVQDRSQLRPPEAVAQPGESNRAASPFVTVVDAEQVRAAVTIALDAAMEKMVHEITFRVLAALQVRKPASQAAVDVPGVVPKPGPPQPAAESLPEPKKPGDSAAPARLESVRRVSPLRSRPGSFLGLDLNSVEPGSPAAAPRSAPDPPFPNARPAADPDPGPRPSYFNPRPADPASRPADPASRPATPEKK
jgi:CheY-like chemotaxis protein